MIRGIGIDIEEIERIRRLYRTYGERFVGKILSAEEISLMSREGDQEAYLAGRFTAKEAFFKAVHPKSGLQWKEVQILKGESGEPRIHIRGRAEKTFRSLGGESIWCSISHSRSVVVSVVVIE